MCTLAPHLRVETVHTRVSVRPATRSTVILKVVDSATAALAEPPNSNRISEVALFLVESGKVVPGLGTDSDG